MQRGRPHGKNHRSSGTPFLKLFQGKKKGGNFNEKSCWARRYLTEQKLGGGKKNRRDTVRGFIWISGDLGGGKKKKTLLTSGRGRRKLSTH